MSQIEKWIYPLLMVCAAGIGFGLAYDFLPTQTITKIKPRTIVCVVNNQQAIASCVRVKGRDLPLAQR
jgi:hypothetical protein